MRDHRVIDERSRALGEAIAARLVENHDLYRHARGTLERWLRTADPKVRPALEEWRAVLSGPEEEVLRLLTSPDERAVRLRQSNPFAGVLPPGERNAILRRFARHESVPT